MKSSDAKKMFNEKLSQGLCRFCILNLHIYTLLYVQENFVFGSYKISLLTVNWTVPGLKS